MKAKRDSNALYISAYLLFAEPPLLVWSDEGETGRNSLSTRLRRLLRNPNPLMGEDG